MPHVSSFINFDADRPTTNRCLVITLLLTIRYVSLWPWPLRIWPFDLAWRVTWSTPPPRLKTTWLSVLQLWVLIFPVGYHWECVCRNCACARITSERNIVIRLKRQCASAMRPVVGLLWAIVIIRLHRSTTYVDAVYCYRPSSVVCPSVTVVSPAKTPEPIEMPFGLWVRIGTRNHVLHGVQIPHG